MGLLDPLEDVKVWPGLSVNLACFADPNVVLPDWDHSPNGSGESHRVGHLSGLTKHLYKSVGRLTFLG